jgi:hypothetical protein
MLSKENIHHKQTKYNIYQKIIDSFIQTLQTEELLNCIELLAYSSLGEGMDGDMELISPPSSSSSSSSLSSFSPVFSHATVFCLRSLFILHANVYHWLILTHTDPLVSLYLFGLLVDLLCKKPAEAKNDKRRGRCFIKNRKIFEISVNIFPIIFKEEVGEKSRKYNTIKKQKEKTKTNNNTINNNGNNGDTTPQLSFSSTFSSHLSLCWHLISPFLPSLVSLLPLSYQTSKCYNFLFKAHPQEFIDFYFQYIKKKNDDGNNNNYFNYYFCNLFSKKGDIIKKLTHNQIYKLLDEKEINIVNLPKEIILEMYKKDRKVI